MGNYCTRWRPCIKGALTTAARSRQDSWASSGKKFGRWRKKLGRKPATPEIIIKSAVTNFCYKFLGQFLPIIVKIRPQLGSLELGRFLGRWLPRPQEILLGHFWVQRPWIWPSGTSGSHLMGDWQIFLKSRRDASFHEFLWNEPSLAGSISLDSTFKSVGITLVNSKCPV